MCRDRPPWTRPPAPLLAVLVATAGVVQRSIVTERTAGSRRTFESFRVAEV